MQPRSTTSEDVKHLQNILQPKAGDIVTWESLEEILAPLTRKDRRFRTIYRAWVHHMAKWHNRKVATLRGIGLHVLHEYDRVGLVRTGMDRTCAAIERVKTDIDNVQIVELTTGQATEASHVRLIVHRLHRAMGDERLRLQQTPLAPLPAERPVPQRAAVFA